MFERGAVRWGLILATAGLLGLGCGQSNDKLCEPGDEQACTCEDGAGGEGLQTCAEDGQAWGSCDCPCVPDCDGKVCGPDGCGGTCGLCQDPPDDTCSGEATRRWYEPDGNCQAGQCDYTAHVEPCPHGCDAGACLPDPCDALTCDQPPGPCHAAAGTCVATPEPHCEYDLLEDGAACDDELICNGHESCMAGTCQPGEAPDCSEFDGPCGQGICDEAAGGCTTDPAPDGSSCGDGSFCNGAETCQAGECVAGQAPDCSHLDSQCAYGDCSEGLTKCVARPRNTGESCDDGLFCNGHESCHNGECVSSGDVICEQPAEPCQRASCDEASQGCLVTYLPDDTVCDDADDCTLDDACQAGACVSGAIAPDGTVCDDLNACTTGETCQTGTCTPAQEICDGEVVMMMYMDADNNLDEYLTSDWHEMEAAGVDDYPWLRVFVVIDHYGTNDAHFYEVHNNSSQELDAPNLGLTVAGDEELDMADGATLTAFIQDVRSYVGPGPAGYLLLSDHGDGWRRARATRGTDDPVFRGSCSDDHGSTPGDVIYTAELRQAIAGQGLHLVGFDACLEGMAEIAYELRNDSLVLVASQELEPGDGWMFTTLLSQFGQAGQANPLLFGELAVATYMDSYGWDDSITLAAYDLSRMDDLATAADAVADALATMDAGALNSTCNAMDWYGCFWGMCEDFTDLTHLALTAKSYDPRDNDATYDALLQVLGEAITADAHRAGHPDAHGMNVYFPCDGGMSGSYGAANLQWAADTSWDEMLSGL